MNVTLHSDHAGRLFPDASSLPLPKTSWVCPFIIAFKVNSCTLLTLWVCIVLKKKKIYFSKLIVFSIIWQFPKIRSEVMQSVCKCLWKQYQKSFKGILSSGSEVHRMNCGLPKVTTLKELSSFECIEFWMYFVSFFKKRSHYFIVSEGRTKINIISLVFLLLVIM